MAKLFIVGFPKDMEEIELVELFSVHGIVNTVTIVTDKNTGQPKGYGFITIADDASAQRAIDALDGAEIDERKISVRFAEAKRASNLVNENRIQKPQQRKNVFAPLEKGSISTRSKRPRRQK